MNNTKQLKSNLMIDDRLFQLIEMLSGKYNDDSPIGSQTKSWQGYRIAEKINDLKLIPDLLNFIHEQENKKLNKYAVIIAGYILKNTRNESLANQLIELTPTLDADCEALYEVLIALLESDVPLKSNPKFVIYYITDERELIRNVAIKVLSNFSVNKAQIVTALQDVLVNFYDENDLNSALKSLEKLKAT